MFSSKLTSQFKVTIPKEIRDALELHLGDSIVFQVLQDGTVILKKLGRSDNGYRAAQRISLAEWQSSYRESEQIYG